MNLSLDTILTNARELVSRLRRDDATADTAVSQAQYVQERILGMKQVKIMAWGKRKKETIGCSSAEQINIHQMLVDGFFAEN